MSKSRQNNLENQKNGNYIRQRNGVQNSGPMIVRMPGVKICKKFSMILITSNFAQYPPKKQASEKGRKPPIFLPPWCLCSQNFNHGELSVDIPLLLFSVVPKPQVLEKNFRYYLR